MYLNQNTEKSYYHFSFLRNIKVHGIYFSTINSYLTNYPALLKSHSHDFYTILLITKGKGAIKINNEVYGVQPQTVCLVAPDQMHSFEGLQGAEGIIFLFCQDFYVEEFSFARLLNVFSYTANIDNNVCLPCVALPDKEYGPVSSTIKSVQYEYESNTLTGNSAIVIRSLLNIMLLKLSDIYEKRCKKTNKANSLITHSLAKMIDQHFIQEHHLGFYASAFNISERHLNEICNNYFNSGLKNILLNRLMQEARRLLLSSDLSVAEIAYNLNFQDNSYFTKVFKKRIGLTPGKFRDIHLKLLPQNR